MDLFDRQSAEGINDGIIADQQCFIEGFIHRHFTGDRGCRDGRTATDDLEFNVDDPVVLDIQGQQQRVATARVTNLGQHRRIFDNADITRIAEVLDHFV